MFTFQCVSAHGGEAIDDKSDDQYSIRCPDHETAVTLISSGSVSVSVFDITIYIFIQL